MSAACNTGGRPGGRWVRLAFLGLAWSLAVPAWAQAIDDEFDRVRGERRIVYTADGSRDTRMPVFTFNAHFVGQAVATGVSVAFVTPGEGESMPGARFAGCHDVAWWIDGQPYATARASHQGRIIDGDMVEMIDQQVTQEWVAAVAAAQSVRYRVCRDDYLLTGGDIRAFGMLTSKLRNAVMSAPENAERSSAPPPTTNVDYQGMEWRPKHGSLFGSGK